MCDTEELLRIFRANLIGVAADVERLKPKHPTTPKVRVALVLRTLA